MTDILVEIGLLVLAGIMTSTSAYEEQFGPAVDIVSMVNKTIYWNRSTRIDFKEV